MTRIAQLEPRRVTVGVDTHRDAHVAVALDQLGRRLGQLEIATTRAGYAQLLAWAESFGEVVVFAVEGCGCYGAGLARQLGAQHVRVVEVMRANRQTRRRRGKSDPTDAEAAARAVLAGEAAAAPKSGDDLVEMIRVLRVVRVTAMKARTQAINALRSLLVTAPPQLRDQLRALSSVKLVRSATPWGALIRFHLQIGMFRVTDLSFDTPHADRAAEVLLARRLYRRRSDGSPIAARFLQLAFPPYWHYDILFALKVLAEAGHIHDPRTADALSLLEAKQLPDGSFPAEARYYRTPSAPSNASPVTWGGTSTRRSNEWVTVDAYTVLASAGRPLPEPEIRPEAAVRAAP